MSGKKKKNKKIPKPNKKHHSYHQSVDHPYLSKPHAVPLVGRLLGLGCVHQLEACLVLLMKVGILTASSKL